MWNNISYNWNNINIEKEKENRHNINESFLTDLSPRDPTPLNNAIELWPHQEAMLHRIRYIENAKYLCNTEHTEASLIRYMDKKDVADSVNVCLGIMNDPPGSGKTYAILTHIITDLVKGTTIVIVPQNIFAQWKQSIEIILKNTIKKCKFITKYYDILDVYENINKVNFYDIILLQDSFAESYLKVLNDNKIEVRRIVIDEIDIIDKFICSSVKAEFVWLMSASYTNQKRLGPYHIGDHTKVICKCNMDFVKASLNLPEIKGVTIQCYDKHIQLFKDVIEDKQLKALNAGDHQILNRIMNGAGIIHPLTYKETAKKIIEYLLKKCDLLEEAEKELQMYTEIKNVSIGDNSANLEKDYNISRDRVNFLKQFKNRANLLQDRLSVLPDISLELYKEKYLENDIVEKMLEDRTTKWLIFNDNGNVLVKYQAFLETKDIKSQMLDGGSQKLIEKTLNEYKENDIQVLLLNSMIEGAGMNLENTTHLLFMHKTEEKFIEQVIGRAQRFGRKTSLNVIMLFNENE
jgi:hypothetical protein